VWPPDSFPDVLLTAGDDRGAWIFSSSAVGDEFDTGGGGSSRSTAGCVELLVNNTGAETFFVGDVSVVGS
jgi:hypothetical protein